MDVAILTSYIAQEAGFSERVSGIIGGCVCLLCIVFILSIFIFLRLKQNSNSNSYENNTRLDLDQNKIQEVSQNLQK